MHFIVLAKFSKFLQKDWHYTLHVIPDSPPPPEICQDQVDPGRGSPEFFHSGNRWEDKMEPYLDFIKPSILSLGHEKNTGV